MVVDFRTESVNLPPGTGRKQFFGSTSFTSNVNRAIVTLNGFKVDFANADHNINIIEIDVDLGGHPPQPGQQNPPPAIEGILVRWTVEANYADKNFDDAYTGYVSVTTIVDRA
jgi:hypothetical protein